MHICYVYAQQIVTDNSLQPQQLIQNLVGDNCVSASNISSQVNGNVNSIKSYGSFDSDASNFPLQSGIVLSTGNVSSVGNTSIAENLSDGNIGWTTDTDVLDVLGIDQTLNATAIEFDFVTANNFVAFKYLFASDEYQQEYPCNFRDVFAILIKRAGTTDPYVNIAFVPNTAIEVSTNTIHPNISEFCEAQNENYFQGYNIASTNFNGHTTVLTANSAIIPGETYHIKFVIADHIDEHFDSAVFIEAEGFGGSIDLGPDQFICGNNLALNAEINNPAASYTWFLNGNEIMGQNNSTLQVNESGTYRAEVSIPITGGSCILEDTIAVEVIQFQPSDPIENLSICDSAESDGVYDFDFQLLKNDEIYANLPSLNYTISYHLSQNGAQDNNNSIIGIYQNVEPEETIFVRIESLDGSCLQIGSFNIIINIPPSTQNYDLEICIDQIADSGITNIIQFRGLLADGILDRTVAFYLTEEDAINQVNEIDDFPDFSTQPPFVVARVSIDGQPVTCFSLAYLNFVYIGPPPLFTDRLILDACIDPLYESLEGTTSYTYDNVPVTFDIEAYFELIETSIFPGSSVRPLELYGLGNPKSWTLTNSPSFTFRLAISFENGNCFSEIALEVHKNYLFNTIGNEKDINRCDDGSNDAIVDFDFEEMNSEIVDGLDSEYASNLVTEYYETEDDRQNGINQIDQTIAITVNNSDILFMRAFYTINGIEACAIYSQINLNIDTALDLPVYTYDYCGNTDPITNTTNIILESISDNIRSDITNTMGMVVGLEYYQTADDAENENNTLVNNYNISQEQDLFVRVTNAFTGCYDITTIQLNINSAIEASNPEPIIICDADQNLSATVNLESALIDLPDDSGEITFTFHQSFNDAIDEFHDFLSIPNPSSYTTRSREIFIRAEIESENCFVIFNFDVLIYVDPQLDIIPDFINCEVNPHAPSDFLFEDKDFQIINNQLGMQVLYFESENDAIIRQSPIDKTVAYQNASNPQTIFVRLENETGNTCYKISPMQIEVRETPDYNIPTDIFECDNNSTGLATTDLDAKISEIEFGSTTDLSITFHLTPLNSEFGTNAIPLNYTATSNPQLIYARVENANTGCYNIEIFNMNTFSLPEVNFEQSLIACGNNFDFSTEWDLTAIELLILEGRQFGTQFSYFESEIDLTDNNPIVNPETYVNTSQPQTVFAKVTNTTTGCFISVPFELILNSPPQIIDFETFNVCENVDNSVNLSDVNEVLLENVFNILVSYHSNSVDAETNNNPLNTEYTYASTTETLYARVEFATTGCYAVYPFELLVNPLPIANEPDDLVACDTDFDGFLEFDLFLQNASILGNQNIDEFLVSYHSSEVNANENLQPLLTQYVAAHGEVIFVRIENISTGCYDVTQFGVAVNPLPDFFIEDQVLCLNDLPLVVSAETNNPLDTYLWSTNATSPEIEIAATGMYSVIITNEFGCENTSTFNVTASESAEIDVIETIDFSDPNNITVSVFGIGNYLYQLNDLPFQTSNVFVNVPIGNNTITIIDQNGCARLTRDVLVIDVPKYITPNNDGYFDTWHITGVETLPGTVIYIFDRYGKLLKELGSNTSGWNGTFNGNLMPAGDYWYSANVIQNGKKFQVKGHFALRR